MIKVNNKQVSEIIQEIQKVLVNRKVKQLDEDIIKENQIFNLICSDFDLGPGKCANLMNSKYKYNMTNEDIIRILRKQRLGNPKERKEILQWADKVTRHFPKMIEGNYNAYKEFEHLRKSSPLKNGKKHKAQARIVVMMIYKKYPELNLAAYQDNLYLFGNTLAKYFLYDMLDIIKISYNFMQGEEKSIKNDDTVRKELPYEQTLRKIAFLESTLERTNMMLQELQDEFEEQLEMSKARELADFFAKLNSEKYGYILDELLVIKKGIDKLQKNHYELPIEINGLLIMTKKLIQFIRDSHIEPMMKANSIKEVTATDIEFCNYEGRPFVNLDEKKKVKVISPGWIYKDKEIQISRPKVKEEH